MITSTPASGDAYLIEETIEVTVTFSEDVATEGLADAGDHRRHGHPRRRCAPRAAPGTR